jgi:hypothetical protein
MRRLRLGKRMNTFCITTSFLFRSAYASQTAIVFAMHFCWLILEKLGWPATVVMSGNGFRIIRGERFGEITPPIP